jgi:hypothetical protein
MLSLLFWCTLGVFAGNVFWSMTKSVWEYFHPTEVDKFIADIQEALDQPRWYLKDGKAVRYSELESGDRIYQIGFGADSDYQNMTPWFQDMGMKP